MTFTHLYNRGINLLRNNLGKILIVGASTTLFLGYDSYKFRKETCPYENNYISKRTEKCTFTQNEKYQNNIYSSIMRPLRLIKDHFWIDDIHHKLIKGVDSENVIRLHNYYNFLTDYQYSNDLINKVYKNHIRPTNDYIIEELIRCNKTYDYNEQKNDYNEQKNEFKIEGIVQDVNTHYDNLLKILKVNMSTFKCSFDLVRELLLSELNQKYVHDLDPVLFRWLIYQARLNNDEIMINKLKENVGRLPFSFIDLNYLDDPFRYR